MFVLHLDVLCGLAEFFSVNSNNSVNFSGFAKAVITRLKN